MQALIIVLLLVGGSDAPAWTPPEKPVPRTILREAHVDAREGREEIALAKYVWYHLHATEYDESADTSRLQTALGYWVRFGEKYPPARAKLRAIRDATSKRVKRGEGLPQSFVDVAAINERLREDKLTRDDFVWLHENKPDTAKEVFRFAANALRDTREYKLYGTYANDRRRRTQIIYFHQRQLKMAANDEKFGAQRLKAAEDILLRDASLLVACLVLAGKEAEAKRTANSLKEQSESKKYHESLEKALQGIVPGRLGRP